MIIGAERVLHSHAEHVLNPPTELPPPRSTVVSVMMMPVMSVMSMVVVMAALPPLYDTPQILFSISLLFIECNTSFMQFSNGTA